MYNELYDGLGNKRPSYLLFEEQFNNRFALSRSTCTEKLAKGGEAGHLGISSIPLVLEEQECSSVILPGVLQRAFALQELFADLALGHRKCVESGAIGEDTVKLILENEGVDEKKLRETWEGQSREQIRFMYGPDLIRDQFGRWNVLEDNIGCVGGVVGASVVLDTYTAASGLKRQLGRFKGKDLERSISEFYKEVDNFDTPGDSIAIPGICAPSDDPKYGFETLWKSEVLHNLGSRIVQPGDFSTAGNGRPVSSVVNLSGTADQGFLNLVTGLFTKEQVPIFGSPFTGMVASKSFHALSDSFVRLYSGAAPILEIPKTSLLRNNFGSLKGKGIVKKSSGCQSQDVYLFDDEDKSINLTALEKKISAWGDCGSVFQELVTPSIITLSVKNKSRVGYVEIRPLVYVYGWKKACVGTVFYGKIKFPLNFSDKSLLNTPLIQFLPVIRTSMITMS